MRRIPFRAFRAHRRVSAALVPMLVTLLATLTILVRTSVRLRPMVETMAVSNAVNQISLAVGRAAADSLRSAGIDYSAFVNVATDADGKVASLSMNATACGEFRRRFIDCLCSQIEQINEQNLRVSIGSLTGILWLSALGPDIRVTIRSVGDVSAEYENEFTSVGINQTKHAVYLRATVAIQLMIPGKIIPVVLEETVCLAETVIVGDVPNAYLNLQDGDS